MTNSTANGKHIHFSWADYHFHFGWEPRLTSVRDCFYINWYPLPYLLVTTFTSVGETHPLQLSWVPLPLLLRTTFYFSSWLLYRPIVSPAKSLDNNIHFSCRSHPLQLKTTSTSVGEHIHCKVNQSTSVADYYTVLALQCIGLLDHFQHCWGLSITLEDNLLF